MNAITFKYDLPLEQTMAFEAVYNEAEQLHLSEKKKIWDAPGSIFAWMFVDGELAGETYGIPVVSSIAGLTDLTDSEKRSGIHCYSNVSVRSLRLDQQPYEVVRKYCVKREIMEVK